MSSEIPFLRLCEFIFYFFMLAKKFNSVEDWKKFFLMLTVRLRCVSEISGILTCFMIKMSNFSFSFLGCFSDLFFFVRQRILSIDGKMELSGNLSGLSCLSHIGVLSWIFNAFSLNKIKVTLHESLPIF